MNPPSKTQWTEGEWETDGGGENERGEKVFAICGPDTRTYDDTIAIVVGKANADLIAVAPEMYRALEKTIDAIDDGRNGEFAFEIRAILARARGETA